MPPAPASDAAAPPAAGAALREAKQRLRETVAAARAGLDAQAHADASAAIAAGIARLPAFAAGRRVLLTLPFRTEWDTRIVARHALAAGKALVVPRVDPSSRMLALHLVADLDNDVADGYRGIPEPRPDRPLADPADIDVVIVPGVAFDALGRRLGYGGGYYDRLLPLLPRTAARIAGAFEAQLVAAVPTAPHDQRVDVIVTEARTLRVPPSVGA